jgi:hypothetical protein
MALTFMNVSSSVPLRLELGPKDLAAGQVVAVRRQATEDPFLGIGPGGVVAPRSAHPAAAASAAPGTGGKGGKPPRAKEVIPIDALAARVPAILAEIQQGMLSVRAHGGTADASRGRVGRLPSDARRGRIPARALRGDPACEADIKNETSATIRVIVPDANPETASACDAEGCPRGASTSR